MDGMRDLGVLVVSCDKNIWLVDLFLDNFQRFWPKCKYKVYLSLEEKEYTNEKLTFLKVFQDNIGDGWSGRVKRCLEKMEEEYALIFLDDFIIEENVNEQLLEEYVQYIQKNKLSNIILSTVPNEKNYVTTSFQELFHRARFGRYKTCLQCGIWNKKILVELLKEKESAWEFELFGNIRSFVLEDGYYAIRSNKYKPIVYNNGYFVVQGKVNIPEKERLERKLGTKINIGDRPCFQDNMVKDDIAFWPRVLRRLKIMTLWLLYFLKYKLRRT